MAADKSSRSSVLLIGGPDAGKSNYIFRLWIALDRARGRLVKDGLPQEIEYLRNGSEQLLEGNFAGHTSENVCERIVIPFKNTQTPEKRGSLVVLDLPGEQILNIVGKRQWSNEWEEMINNECSCLLLVRATSDMIVAPLDWATSFDRFGGVLPSATTIENVDSPTSVLSPKALPTQVILTEWLQFLRAAFTARVGGDYSPHIGIVVTAWDAVPADQQTQGPEAYIKDNFPMLHQYALSNASIFHFQYFGVSVVSGDLHNDIAFRQTYLKGAPQDFGTVVYLAENRTKTSEDLTVPVAWALGIE